MKGKKAHGREIKDRANAPKKEKEERRRKSVVRDPHSNEPSQ